MRHLPMQTLPEEVAMSGYRQGYSEQHSPYYAAGRADGAAGKPPDPAKKASGMYRRGYVIGIRESGKKAPKY